MSLLERFLVFVVFSKSVIAFMNKRCLLCVCRFNLFKAMFSIRPNWINDCGLNLDSFKPGQFGLTV